ncbi:MAG: MBL fold metallo-hydrolase, partial [Kofleriaceae bacterium]|nr:MBL fold metallo-hydrolase [Kofleriaceae bacterium]
DLSEERQYLGESPARRALLPYLRHRRIDAIDLAILSHPHPDHYLGLQAVAREMPIAELWSVHEKRETPGQFELWLERLERGGTVVRQPRLGLAWSERGVDLQVLWPRYEGPIAAPDPILSVNDNSLVVRIDFAGRRILFTGDIESEAEELLVSEYASELVADVVKVAHHGSPTSSTRAFAEAIGPAVAVISCGVANRFNFPGPEVVDRWLDSAHLLLRTDEVGSVSVEISRDGEMQIETSLPF